MMKIENIFRQYFKNCIDILFPTVNNTPILYLRKYGTESSGHLPRLTQLLICLWILIIFTKSS